MRIFARYSDENLVLNGPAQSHDHFGRIDRIRVEHNRLLIEGWTPAEAIGVRLNRATLWTVPTLSAPRDGGEAYKNFRGFTLDLPFEPGQPVLLTRGAGEEHETPVKGFSAAEVHWARLRLFPRYIVTLLSLLPQIRRWKWQGDHGAREVIKERLGLVPRSNAAEMSPAPLSGAPESRQGPPGAIVILPIFNAFSMLGEALRRMEENADRPLRVILIEDCSTDLRVRPFVSAWAQDPARRFPVQLLLNETNLGFIGSVNRGLAYALEAPEGWPVILFNSDAMVPQRWTSRLLAPLADPGVASVTPMSNDAEIFNVPVICQRHPLPEGMVDRLDAAARRLAPEASEVDAPTGVGFCMALSPRFLKQVPALDTTFGRGYGEETDWCQKTRALGGRHVGIANLFVEHRGGMSFGSEAKRKLLEQNGAVISHRYPGYDREVQEFIRSDPMTTARLALGLSWAALRQEEPVTVWLAHAMGGGAENDLQRRVAAQIAGGQSAVILRVGQGHRWKLELHSFLGVTQGLTNDIDLIRDLIARLPRRRIAYSCGVGERDPLALPELLLALAGRGADPLPGGPQPVEVLFHDFFPVSPSYTLLSQENLYRGLPAPGTAAGDDPAHEAERPGGVRVSLHQWQAEWGKLLAAAEKIVTFSDSSRAIVTAIWPAAAERIRVEPHELLASIPRITPVRGQRPVIGVLGNIGVQKGAAVVQRLSRKMKRDPRLGLVVLGQFDPAYRLSAPARIHGSYEWRDLPMLVERYQISAWLIPSVWPETFSFTTHEAIATGMPVIAFDLGAQGDAVRRAIAAGQPGALLPLERQADLGIDDLLRCLAEGAGAGDQLPSSRSR